MLVSGSTSTVAVLPQAVALGGYSSTVLHSVQTAQCGVGGPGVSLWLELVKIARRVSYLCKGKGQLSLQDTTVTVN